MAPTRQAKRVVVPPAPPTAVGPDTVEAAVAARPERRRLALEQKRRRVRTELWPGSENLYYNRKSEIGFTTIPRTLPLICSLIRAITHKGEGDASRVYLDLW